MPAELLALGGGEAFREGGQEAAAGWRFQLDEEHLDLRILVLPRCSAQAA